MSHEPQRKGQSDTPASGGALDPLRADERSIFDALRAAEAQPHPCVIVVYYNGDHWMLVGPTRPRWLSKE